MTPIPSPSLAALALLGSAGLFLGGCASDEPPPPPPPTSTISIGASPGPSGSLSAVSGVPEAAIPVARVTSPPVPTLQTRPIYPADLHQSGTEGNATVAFVVEPDGRVGYAQAVNATNAEFGQAAIAAIKGWTFRPGTLDGRIVKTYMEIPIYFTLTQEPAAPLSGTVATAEPANERHGAVDQDIPPRPSGVYDVSEVDRAPVPTSQSRPIYPADLRQGGVQGSATVLFIVEVDGTVTNVLTIHATDAAFGDAAAAAVSTWRFTPASVGAAPVRCRMMVPLQFYTGD